MKITLTYIKLLTEVAGEVGPELARQATCVLKQIHLVPTVGTRTVWFQTV